MEVQDEIKAIEDEIQNTTYNKATQHHIGKLKAKLALLKEKQEKGKKSAPGKGYSVKKTGDATLLLVGFPSVGKSTLLNLLTNAESKIAEYDFTTLDVIPGMMECNGAQIQILDVPGVIEGVSSGKGRGKEVLSVVRAADMVLLMVNANNVEKELEVIKKELYNSGFRLNETYPDVMIYKKSEGGVKIYSTKRLTKMNRKTIYSILAEYKMINAEIIFREDVSLDQFIDVLAANRVYTTALVVINKTDLIDGHKKQMIQEKFPNSILISAIEKRGLDQLKKAIWDQLGFMRVYMKKLGAEPDKTKPLIVLEGSKVEDICRKIHRDFQKNFKCAKIWGPSAKFPAQTVGLDHMLKDEDVVELHMER